MSRGAQAWTEAAGRLWRPAACFVLGASVLSGCAMGNILKRAETDASIITSSVPAGPQKDPIQEADAATIRNAVTSANLEQLGGGSIPWANAGTGSRGSIGPVIEYREQDVLCRRFTASRESFEGVMLYSGDACLRGNGFWWMRAFDAS